MSMYSIAGTGYLLTTLDNDTLKLVESIPLMAFGGIDKWVVECPAFEEYGYGNTLEEAYADLKLSIVDFYWSLKRIAAEKRLGKPLQRIWDAMQKWLVETA